MKCPYCGTPLADGTKFCPGCGAQQTNTATQSTQQTGTGYNQQTPQQTPAAPAKKKKTFWIILIILIVVGIIGAVSNTESEPTTLNPAYSEILSKAGIMHQASFTVSGANKTKNFIKEDDYVIHCEDYACDNDTIKAWKETYYFLIPATSTTEEIDYAFSSIKDSFTEYEKLLCCNIKYSKQAKYILVEATFTDVDKRLTIKELSNAGFLDSSDVDFISMKKTTTNLSNDGFVPKYIK